MSYDGTARQNELGNVTLDFTSASSNSSVVGPPDTKKPESSEKVSAWLRGDHDQGLPNFEQLLEQPSPRHPEPVDLRKCGSAQDPKLTYEAEVAPVKHKMQYLLTFGEYTLFRKWRVLAEGDFIPFCPGKNPVVCEKYYEDKLARKRAKILLRDVRTLAITKNWLVMARLSRLYQVERDAVVPSGISLELRRLVPLRYLRICIARPAARVIGIANQNGITKQYQMLDKPSSAAEDPFMTWRNVIGRLCPNLCDDVLYQTLNTFDRWQRMHVCRLTIHPDYQHKSGISLDEWQVKLGEKEPEKCRCDAKPAPPPAKRPLPPPPRPSPPPRTPTASYSSDPYQPGFQVSIGDSVPMTPSDAPEEIEGIETEIGSSVPMSEVAVQSRGSGSGATSYGSGAGVSLDMPPPSAGRRPRRSIRSIFRLGFLTTKSRRKSRDDGLGEVPCPDAGAAQPPSPQGRPLTQRRMSRLEMNEPIEDIFSGVTFETIQKRPSIPEKASDDGSDDTDDDIIEDPEVIMRSLMKDKIRHGDDDPMPQNGEDNKMIADIIDDINNAHHDVIPRGNLEKELLLPESERKIDVTAPPGGKDSNKTSEEDLR